MLPCLWGTIACLGWWQGQGYQSLEPGGEPKSPCLGKDPGCSQEGGTGVRCSCWGLEQGPFRSSGPPLPKSGGDLWAHRVGASPTSRGRSAHALLCGCRAETRGGAPGRCWGEGADWAPHTPEALQIPRVPGLSRETCDACLVLSRI